MELSGLLSEAAVFDGLDAAELSQVAQICRPAVFHKGELLTQQGAPGHEVFMIQSGLVEIRVNESGEAGALRLNPINMGAGQVVGEISLIDGGPRSATVRCVTDACDVLVIEREAFERLTQAQHHIGLVVYRNLAADLAFKLRHRHLAGN